MSALLQKREVADRRDGSFATDGNVPDRTVLPAPIGREQRQPMGTYRTEPSCQLPSVAEKRLDPSTAARYRAFQEHATVMSRRFIPSRANNQGSM